MTEIQVTLTMVERSILRELLLLKSEELSEGIAVAENTDAMYIAKKLTAKRDALVEILAKL